MSMEHNPHTDTMQALLQLLRYKQMVWQKDEGPLTPILPVVFYHGPHGRMPERFSQLFHPDTPPPHLRPQQVEFQAILYNLSSLTEDEIQQKIYTRITDPVIREDIMPSTAQMLKQEGRQENAHETVVRMLAEDIALDVIARVTGLTPDEIENISQQNEQTDQPRS